MDMTLKDIYPKFSTPFGMGDKGTHHSYLEVYEEVFHSRRQGISLLELGVAGGHSLAMWAAYFKDSNIIGLDLLEGLMFPKVGFEFYKCDVTNSNQIASTLPINMTFDFIIDDASHVPDHQLKSFDILFPKLKDNGLYFIEDVSDLSYVSQRLPKNAKIYDFRSKKNVKDDVLIIISKSTIEL